MPPLALCSRPACDFRIELQDRKTGMSISAPSICPKCEAPLISVCPACGFLLIQIPAGKHPLCSVCRADIRSAFARLVFGVHRRRSPKPAEDPFPSDS